jgi:glycerophosphoryl diester phosphodiesterase
MMVHCADKFQVVTFEEFISIALNAERVVGIYPEIKSPIFVNNHVSFGAYGL